MSRIVSWISLANNVQAFTVMKFYIDWFSTFQLLSRSRDCRLHIAAFIVWKVWKSNQAVHRLSATRRMAIANGMYVSFCNQPKAHFGLPWVYASGTIAVNVTWMERGFNAGQMHTAYTYLSSTVYEWAIERYWSEIAKIATFSYPLHLTPPLGVFPLEFREKFGPQKTRIMGLPGS